MSKPMPASTSNAPSEGGEGPLLEKALREYASLVESGENREGLEQRILASAMNLSEAPSARLVRLEEEEGISALCAWKEEGTRGPAGLRFSEAGPGQGPSRQPALTIPLRTSARVYGALQIDSGPGGGELGERRIELLKLFGAMASAMLEGETKGAGLRLENALLKELSLAVDLLLLVGKAPEATALALDEALRLANCARGAFFVRDLDTGVYHLMASRGFSQAQKEAYGAAPLEERAQSLPLKLLRRLEPVSPPDLSGHRLLSEVFPPALRRFLCLPAMEGEELFGFLMMGGPEQAPPIASGPLEDVLKLFAHQAGMAVRNCLLFSQLSQKKKDLEAATESLVHSEKLALAGKMAAAVAHQVRNPLSVISAHIQMIISGMQDADPLRPALDVVMAKVSEADHTIRELMELSRPLCLNVELKDLQESLETIQRFIQPRCNAQGVELTLALLPNLPKVWFDETQLQRCLLDLCLNGLHEMKKGGRLVLAAASFGTRVELRVEDSGPGIPQEKFEKIFEPFFTTKAKGTGLGLYNVRRICDGMGVDVSVGNVRPSGASFRFSFPVSHDRPAAILRQSMGAGASIQGVAWTQKL